MSGTVIQGSFPQGIPRHVRTPAPPIQPARPRTYDERASEAHRRAADVAQPSVHGAFVLPAHLATFGRRAGQKLAPALQQKMESYFRADFSNVEVHVGPEAASIGALAFTQGSHIYFAPGQYRPDTVVGQQLLGHELTHVVQQRAGRVRHPFGRGVAVVQDPGLEAEAERMGGQAALHQPVVQPHAPSVLLHADPALHVSGPVRLAAGKYRITAGSVGQPAGSVTLHSRGCAMELTDLGVETAHRRRGLGHALLLSAARAGARLGKSTVRLASQDDGSGALTRWYRSMGFRQVGVDGRGLPRLEAPIRRVISGVARTRSSPALPVPAGLVQRAAAPVSKYKQSGKNTCWAAAFGMVLGVSESTVRMHWSLDAAINALSYDDTEPLVTELGLTVVKNWHDAAMAGKLPLAVGLPQHWVVVTAATKNKSNTRITDVTYMDPWTGKTQTVDGGTFMKLEPTIGVYK